MATNGKAKRSAKTNTKKVSRTRKPSDMSVDEWQRSLRRAYGEVQGFTSKNIGSDPVFSEFLVTNPSSKSTYRVAIRGVEPGENYCSCPDFEVNTLGTCKHIEWLVAKLKRKSGNKKILKKGFSPLHSEVYLSYGAQRVVRFRPGVGCPEAIRKLASKYFDENGELRADGYIRFQDFCREVAQSEHDVRIYDDTLRFVAQVRDDAVRRKRIDDAFPIATAAARINKLLKVNLYPYQQAGALFAAKAGRCLIADEMGLGKTIQSIAAIEILASTMGIQRVLVVAPTALKHQWQQEVERFVGRTAEVVEGFRAQRRQSYQKDSFFKITNYDVIHLDIDFINEWRPDVVILDEAQRIKNWQTRRAKAVKQIDSEYAIVLTGTPLENRLEELHSIMGFVDRYRLGPLFRFLHTHQHTDDNGKVIGYRCLDRIGDSLASLLVRRRKAEVLKELPERTDKHFFVEMTDEQWRHHDENQRTVSEVVAKWRRLGFLSDKDQRRLMIALQNMRMSCNSSFLLDKESDHSVKLDECSQLLDEILEEPGNKAVIFSQWLGTHELLIRRLDAKKTPFAYYHGSLDGHARKKVIERFKRDPACRILLCTDSGGVGLNLQEASIVINMDQPWNPAVIEQRIGRVHRLGQQKHVQVYHFVSQGTIENGMLNVQKFKTSMFAGVLDGGETEVFMGGSKMKKFMESVEGVSSHVPDRMPSHEQTPVSEKPIDEVAVEPEPREAKASEAVAPWNELLVAGLDFLGKLGRTIESGSVGTASNSGLKSYLFRNESTGREEFRIPMPDAASTKQIGDILLGVANLFRGAVVSE